MLASYFNLTLRVFRILCSKGSCHIVGFMQYRHRVTILNCVYTIHIYTCRIPDASDFYLYKESTHKRSSNQTLYCIVRKFLFFAPFSPYSSCYHNICSHSHLPPNLVVLPHLGQADGGSGFSLSSNMSSQPPNFFAEKWVRVIHLAVLRFQDI